MTICVHVCFFASLPALTAAFQVLTGMQTLLPVLVPRPEPEEEDEMDGVLVEEVTSRGRPMKSGRRCAWSEKHSKATETLSKHLYTPKTHQNT